MTDYIAEEIRRALMERPQKMLSNLIMMIEHDRLPGILTLEEIGLLSGYSEPYQFVEFIKTTALEIIDVDGIPSATSEAYEAYLKQIDRWPPVSPNLAAWWKESEPLPETVPADWKDGQTMTKLEKQQEAILKVIKAKQFNPMAIPDGEKGTIEIICKADYPLLFDRESSFLNAWKKSRYLFKMANHSSFAKRGN